MPMNIRVLVADDEALVRAGLRLLVNAFEGMCVVAEAADGREAVAVTAQQHPDVVIMDLAMPQLNGFEATEQITNKFPRTRVLILSSLKDEACVARAFNAGAAGYILRSATPV